MVSRTTIQSKLARTSLVVLAPALLSVTLSVVALNVYLSGKNQAVSVARIEASLTAKGRLLTKNNAQALVGMAEGNAFLQIKDLVASTVKDDPDVIYGLFMPADSTNPCEVADEADTAQAEGAMAKVGEIKDQAGVVWAREAKALQTRKMGSGPTGSIEFTAPVGEADAPMGWILYKLSTRAMSEAIESEKAASRQALMVVIGILLALGGVALAVALAKFRSAARKLSGPVTELSAAAELIKGGDYKTVVCVDSDDEIGSLAETFETMRQTVQKYTEHLEDLVAEKMRQVRDILDNVEQGLFVVGLDGQVAPEYSKAAPTILGVDNLGNVSEALHLSPAQEDDFKGWLSLVRAKNSSMRWDKLTKVAPVQDLEISGNDGQSRFVRVRYQRMFDKNRELERVMVLAVDETESRRIERVVAEEKERHENEVKTILGLVNNLPEVIRDYMKDTRNRMDTLEDICRSMLDRSLAARERHPDQPGFHPGSEEIANIFRDLHTIKGNSATYGFERLGRLAHQGEDILEDLKEPITVRTAVTLRALLEKLDEMDKAYQEILSTEKKLSGGATDGDMLVQVSERKLEHVRKMAHTLHVPAHASTHPYIDPEAVQILTEACEHLRDVPLVRLADKYRGMIERLAERLEKQIRFEVVPGHLEVGPTFFAPLDEALVHILRNSVDHGLESPADRTVAGKAECGIIRMQINIEEDCVRIQIADDGHGINADRVAEKAIAEGILSRDDAERMGRDQKLLLIFESGISTATSITDVSGRGVGMAAVRESIESMGGNIKLESEAGKGTVTTLTIPLRDI